MIGSQMTFRINKGLKSLDNVFAINGLSSSRPRGRREKGELEKASLLLTQVPLHVLIDKSNPGIVANPESKSLATLMFQSHRGGRGEECHDKGKRNATTSRPRQPWLSFLHSSPFFPKDGKS